MFIGHLAVGFAAKRVAPRTSLGVLLASSVAVDILYFVFLLAGLEQMRIEPGNTAYSPLVFDHYPFSHSLLAAAVWSVFLAFLYFTFTRYRTGAVAVGCVSISHWFLDAIVHRPDLPLYPGHTALVGLGLWHSLAATFLVEGAIFLAGVWIYFTAGKARDRIGKHALFGFVAFVLLLYVATALGPPPPDPKFVAVSGLVLTAILLLWAAWFDRHRISPSALRI
jgi:membrane-bound metal-dependent hydrolase YbcI (DUF457 family)